MTDDFIIIAHRGASGDYPENTLLAFRQALAAGATWLELDVQLSADGALVVIHDETLERTTDGTGPVAEKSLAQLRRLDAGRGERIPLLAEVLDLAAGRATVNIELKGRGTAGPVAELLRQRQMIGALDAILASSLYEEELISFAGQLPQVRLAPVADRVGPTLLPLAEELNAWSVHLEKSCITKGLAEEINSAGRKLLVYTVNDPETLRRLRAWGVSGVFSDFPAKCFDALAASFHRS